MKIVDENSVDIKEVDRYSNSIMELIKEKYTIDEVSNKNFFFGMLTFLTCHSFALGIEPELFSATLHEFEEAYKKGFYKIKESDEYKNIMKKMNP